jgi:hypothetical protein
MSSIKDLLLEKGSLSKLASRCQLAKYKERTYYTFTATYVGEVPNTTKEGKVYMNVKVHDLRDAEGNLIDDHAWIPEFPHGKLKYGDRVKLIATVKQYRKSGKTAFIGFGLHQVAEMTVIS